MGNSASNKDLKSHLLNTDKDFHVLNNTVPSNCLHFPNKLCIIRKFCRKKKSILNYLNNLHTNINLMFIFIKCSSDFSLFFFLTTLHYAMWLSFHM